MRWFKVIVTLLCLLAASEHAMGQGADALAYETIQPTRIQVGESAILRVTSFGRLKDLTLPTIPGLQFEDLGRQQGLEYVNGTGIPATFVQIRVTAQFAGVFTIPGLIPSSPSIGLEVVKPDAPNPYTFPRQQPAAPTVVTASLPKGEQLQAGGAVFVHLAIPTRDIYVGESVPVDIELGVRPGIVTTINGLPTLSGSDFTLNNLPKQPERREQSIDGGTFVVFTWHSAIAAVKPGDFSLSAQTPVSVKINTLSKADRAVASRLAWPLLQSMYNSIAPKDVMLESAPSRMKVLPLPTEGQPKDFSGAVGNFEVSSDLSAATAAAGDPLTLRLHIRGTGNFDRVDSTMLEHLDHWKTYPSKSKFTPSDTVGYQGEKVFEQPLIAAQSGDQFIPGLQFSYFNPNTRRYEQAQTSPIEVTIAGSLASGSLTALNGAQSLNGPATAGALQGLRSDHAASQRWVSELRPLYFRTSFLGIQTGLAFLLAGGWFAARPHAARAGSATSERVLAQLEVTARAGDASAFFEAARKTLLQEFASRWRLPVDQITSAELRARIGANAGEIEHLFTLADEARYAGYQPGDTDLRHWLGLIRSQLTSEAP